LIHYLGMGNVEFEESYDDAMQRLQANFVKKHNYSSKISEWFVRNKFARDDKQAKIYMIIVTCICFVLAILIPLFFLH
jgi:hypothetical protein